MRISLLEAKVQFASNALGLCRLVSPSSQWSPSRVPVGADTGSDTASHGAPGSGSHWNGGCGLLDERNRDRVISLSDGGSGGEDAFRAEISVCSRFVLRLRAVGRIAIAGFFATFLVAGVKVDVTSEFSEASRMDFRLVSPSSQWSPSRVPVGADTGSDTASHGAPGSGSHCQTAPKELCPGTWGGLA